MRSAQTVYCPSCKRNWTGLFDDPVPEKAVCQDCINEGEGTIFGHPDRVLNPNALKEKPNRSMSGSSGEKPQE